MFFCTSVCASRTKLSISSFPVFTEGSADIPLTIKENTKKCESLFIIIILKLIHFKMQVKKNFIEFIVVN